MLWIAFSATFHQVPVEAGVGVETASFGQRKATGPNVQTDGGTVISNEGLVEPVTFVNLSFQIGGTIAEIGVEEGQQVQAGDVLIQLEDSDMRLALTQAEARLTSAESGLEAAQNQLRLAEAGVAAAEAGVVSAETNLQLIEAGPRPEEIAAAEANVQAAESAVSQAVGNRDMALDVTSEADIFAAEAQVAQAYSDLRRLEEAYDTILTTCSTLPDGSEFCPFYGPVEEETRDQLAAARLSYQAAVQRLEALQQGPSTAQQRAAAGGISVAIANRDAAEAQLALLLAGAMPEEITIAELRVSEAEVGVALAQAEVARAAAAVRQAEVAVVQAQANIHSIQAALARSTLLAPYDGEVSRISASVGQLVQPGSAVLMLADFSGWLVKTTDLTEVDVSSVVEGAPVTASFDAIPGERVGGVVTKVALIGDDSLGDVAYEAEILLDDSGDLPIRWGMTAFVEIEVGQ
jgi:multidrug resistance efflux pump